MKSQKNKVRRVSQAWRAPGCVHTNSWAISSFFDGNLWLWLSFFYFRLRTTWLLWFDFAEHHCTPRTSCPLFTPWTRHALTYENNTLKLQKRTKYKTIDKKVQPVLSYMPDPTGQVFLPVIIPPLLSLPLDPPFLQNFLPTRCLTQECLKKIIASVPKDFLWPWEIDLLVFVLRMWDQALAFEDSEWGRSLPSSMSSCGFWAESWNSMEFHGISMESNWLEPQPFCFPIPWKFRLFSKEFQQKWLESWSLWEWFLWESMEFHWDSAEILLESHGNHHYIYSQK